MSGLQVATVVHMVAPSIKLLKLLLNTVTERLASFSLVRRSKPISCPKLVCGAKLGLAIVIEEPLRKVRYN